MTDRFDELARSLFPHWSASQKALDRIADTIRTEVEAAEYERDRQQSNADNLRLERDELLERMKAIRAVAATNPNRTAGQAFSELGWIADETALALAKREGK